MEVWRAAGISYLRYANLCASHVRRALKTELQTAAAARDLSEARIARWVDGVRQAPVAMAPQAVQKVVEKDD